MTEERTLTHSEQQAVAQLESIKAMIAAVECDRERLEELRDEHAAHGAAIAEAEEEHEADQTEESAEALEEAREASHEWELENLDELTDLEAACKIDGDEVDEEQARERIQEDPLSVEVRGDWHAPGETDDDPSEYFILLCTGGPACRIVGGLNGGEPDSARLEHQDWGTPWTQWITTGSDNEALLSYARCFFYGE